VRSRMYAPALCFACLLATGAPAAGQEQEKLEKRDRVYLAEVALTLEGARRLMLWVETHFGDLDFAQYAYPLAQRYVEMAGHLTPSQKLVPAHPHLLLVVENVERAVDAAAANQVELFRKRARTVREELLILDGVLKQLKFKLPELPR
jgi:hypothetical protein